jgi:hypothetical protein
MVENVGTRCMKGSTDYLSKLDTEFRKIGFIKSILCNVKYNYFLLVQFQF